MSVLTERSVGISHPTRRLCIADTPGGWVAPLPSTESVILKSPALGGLARRLEGHPMAEKVPDLNSFEGMGKTVYESPGGGETTVYVMEGKHGPKMAFVVESKQRRTSTLKTVKQTTGVVKVDFGFRGMQVTTANGRGEVRTQRKYGGSNTFLAEVAGGRVPKSRFHTSD